VPHLRRTGLSPLSEQTPPPSPASCSSPPAPRCLPARRLALETRSSPALSLERCRLVPAPPASQARSYPPTFVSRIDRGGEPFSFPRRRHRCEAPGRGGGGGGVGLGSTPFAWVPSPARAKRPPRPPTPMVHAWVAAAFGGETSQLGVWPRRFGETRAHGPGSPDVYEVLRMRVLGPRVARMENPPLLVVCKVK
jgi:hypothetical protein